MKLRLLLIQAKGSTGDFNTKLCNFSKLPGALEPYTRVGLIITTSRPYLSDISFKPFSAKYLEFAYALCGFATLSELKGLFKVDAPFTPIELTKTKRFIPAFAACSARRSVSSVLYL